MRSIVGRYQFAEWNVKTDFSAWSLHFRDVGCSAAKFGEDKARRWNCCVIAAARPSEEFSKVFSRFLADFRACERTSVFFINFSFIFFSILYGWYDFTFDFIFARGYIRATIFSGRRSLFRSVSLLPSRIPRTHATCTIKDAYVCIMTRERTRVRRADRTVAENIA